jgi:hypothetical protein
MTLITDKPAGLASSNELDKLPADILSTPPAYLKFSASPAPMENPPAFGDVETYIVRVVCTGEHGPLGRKDGELRYERSMSIQAIWKPGERPPTADDDEQPPLFGTDGEAEPEALGDILEGVDRPAFSNLTGGDE